MVCYRRHGHNEGDEPSFTQPLLYEKIRRTKPVRERYTEELLRQGLLDPEDVGRIEADLHAQLQSALAGDQDASAGARRALRPARPLERPTCARRQAGDDPETRRPRRAPRRRSPSASG